MASKHLVIDGSNIATEGRSLPSLVQLDEAVRAFLKERPHDTYTVVVDATFGHRIDPSEKEIYEEALAANEMITPPAGTIGRGDKFLLEIADRANATVFSNDSFQEFHGEYEWLFDSGRLIGGKPVPQVGWIFTERTPVRGPRSRMASRAGGERRGRLSASSGRARRSPLSELPPAVPSRPPPRRRLSALRAPAATEAVPDDAGMPVPGTSDPEVAPAAAQPGSAEPRRRRRTSSAPEPVNPPLAFIEFIAEHPPGSTVEGEVVSFTSHGAFVQVGDVRCYVALKFMGDPAPRSARDLLSRGEVRSFVVQALDPPRRGIDLALPGFEDLPASFAVEPAAEEVEVEAEAPPGDVTDDVAPTPRARRRRLRPEPAAEVPVPADEAPVPADEAPAAPVTRIRKRRAKTVVGDEATASAAQPSEQALALAEEAKPVELAGDRLAELVPGGDEALAGEPSPEAAVKKKRAAAKKVPAKRAAAKKIPAKKAATTRAATTKAADEALPATTGTATDDPAIAAASPVTGSGEADVPEAATTTAATTTAAATTKKAAAKKTTATKATATKATATKATATKAVAKKAAAKKTVAKKTVAKKAAAKKAPARKAPAKRAAAKRAADSTSAPAVPVAADESEAGPSTA